MILNSKIKQFAFLFFTALISAQSQEHKSDSLEINNLDEVIVSATRTLRQLSSLPLPAQLISKKEIQQINSVRLSNLLREQTGLTTIPDFGGGEGIQLQGLDSQYTLILIDGVPLIGRSAGTLDLSRISVGNVKQVEIVKGASSSLYGSEALGGVINIISEKPKEGFEVGLGNRYGTFNSNDLNANLSYRRDKFAISVFFDDYRSDGYNLNTNSELNTVEPFVNNTFNTKVLYDFSDKTNLMVSGRYYKQTQDYVVSEELSGESEINEWNTHLKFEQTYSSKWKSHLEFYVTRYKANEFLDNVDGSLNSESDFNQLFIRPELRATYTSNKKSTFTTGFGLTHESLDRTDFTTRPEFNSPYVYLQYDINPTDKVNMIVGARYDAHNKYRSQFSPKVALRYKINDNISVKGSLGYGFKAPDFRQLYFDFSNSTVGYSVLGYNAVTTRIPEMESEGQIAKIVVPISEFENELKPENSLGINFGADFKPTSQVSLSVNIFKNSINDLIDTRVIANKTNGQNVFSYYNVNEVYTQGFEFNSTWKINKGLKMSAGYQLLYAKDKKAEKAFDKGEVYARASPNSPSFQLNKSDYFGLYNRSRHMANVKLFYSIPKWDMNTNIRGTYRSSYGLYDSNGNAYLDSYDEFVDGYSIWNWALNKSITKNYTVGVGIDNILGFTDTQNISNVPGRILYGKLNIQF